MKSFRKTFEQIDALTQTEQKPLVAMLAKLMEEVGELAVAVNVNDGHITHKTLDEPLEGEVADVCQVAISILCRHLAHLTPEQRWSKFESYISNKTDKWARIQADENAIANAPKPAAVPMRPAMRGLASTPWTYDLVAKHVRQIVSEQLGLGVIFNQPAFKDDDSFVNDLGADSLDEVELAMAIEDEFDIEVSDDQAELATNTTKAILTVCRILNVPTLEDELNAAKEDMLSPQDFIADGLTREDEMFGFVGSIDGDVVCDQASDEPDLHAPLPGSGYHRTLSERMQERSRLDQQKRERK